MTNQDFAKFNTYLPYAGGYHDCLYQFDRALYSSSSGWGLLSFPASVSSVSSVEVDPRAVRYRGAITLPKFYQASASDYESRGRVLFEIDSMIKNRPRDAFQVQEVIKSLESWIQFLADQSITVDINRITRYAIRSGQISLVRHLVLNRGAKLTERDEIGRSAVFYAAQAETLEVLQYIAGEIGMNNVRKEMNRSDAFDATPLFYATRPSLIDNFEYCLTAGARPNDMILACNVPPTSWNNLQHLGIEQQTHLYLMLFGQLRSYLNLPLYAEWINSVYCDREGVIFTVHRMQNDPGIINDEENSLTWIHVPWTNAIFKTIQQRIRNLHVDGSRVTSQEHLELFLQSFRKPPVVPGDPDLDYRMPTYETREGQRFGKATYAAIVFPCIILQTKKSHCSSRIADLNARGLIENIDMRRMIQTERTLDEAYYPSLNKKVLEKRNKDQVVSRESLISMDKEESNDDITPVLTVHQFWIWRLGNHLLSAYSMPGWTPEHLCPYGFNRTWGEYGRQTLFGEQSDEWKSHCIGVSTSLHMYPGPDLAMGILLADQIDKFGRAQSNHRFQAPLDIFETSVVRVMSSVEDYMDPETSETPEIRTERKFMHDISSIRSELSMIDEILRQQEQIIDSLIKNSEVEIGQREQWDKVEDGKKLLGTYRERVKKIDKDAERIEKIIQDQLNLKRTFATIRDTRTSLLLGTAVIGFTIVTIIFTPIAFMAALFALPIDSFLRNQVIVDGTDAFSTSHVAKWFLTAEIASLVVTGLAVWASVSLLGGFGGTAINSRDTKGKASEGPRVAPASGPRDGNNDLRKDGVKLEEMKKSGSNLNKYPVVSRLWKRSDRAGMTDA